MLSIRHDALNNKTTDIIKNTAKKEGVTPEFLMNGVAAGNIAIFKNKNRDTLPCATGKGLKTKVNANIGTSPIANDVEYEIEKLIAAEKAGADAVMDLSVGGDINAIRAKIMENTRLPLGTVPIYQASHDIVASGGQIQDLKINDFLKVIEEQAKQGVDFMTIHAGVTKSSIASLKNEGRILNVVSRGGAMLVKWIQSTGNENPYFEHFDELLDILVEHDVVLSLGDGMRPGCIDDASDRGQIAELIVLGELTNRAWKKGVQVIIEGPGHVPLDQIILNVELQKKLCHGAPFYVLGPLVTDIAVGYDHFAGGIGGALAAAYGVDFLCYLTPAEHLRLPTIEDVREGVIATKIAAHAGDIVKGVKGAREKDYLMAQARKNLDWDEMFKYAIDPEKAKKYRESSGADKLSECSMCGEFCSIKTLLDNF